MNYHFRKAVITDIPYIWKILHEAIEHRKNDGSMQWQDGYPNLNVIQKDVESGFGFVLTEDEIVIGYCAILINDEPEYTNIKGNWLSNNDFIIFHRLAISKSKMGKGFAKKIIKLVENFALNHNIYSVKADTNYDNIGMLKIFELLGYTYCGKVYFRGSERLAFEKILTNTEIEKVQIF